jgi:leader peptidase (prepilin peptidase)/N-methyltransferase
LAVLLLSAALALPIALVGWSLPDRWFDPAAVGRLRSLPGLVSLSLPVLCALWAAAAVPGYALPGILALGWTLIVLSLVDIRTFLLPDCLTLPLIAVGVAHSAWLNSPPVSPFGDYLLEAGWGMMAGAAGFLVMALIARTFRHIRGIEGLGLGDAKLFAAAGAWLGLLALPSIMLIAALTAVVAALAIHRIAKPGKALGTMPIPFGPFLAGATWIVALYGPLSFM